jgi:hypothetical protein
MGFIGRLEDMSFPDIVQMLSMSRRTGKLTVTEGASRAFVVFRQGDIVAASLGRGRETLGKALVRRQLVAESTLALALEVQKNLLPDRLLGTILLEMNAVDDIVLSQVVREQVEEVLAELVNWENGSFKFDPMALGDAMSAELNGKDLVVPSGLRAEHAMLEAMRRHDERLRDEATQTPPVVPPPPLRFSSLRKRGAADPAAAPEASEAVEVFSPAQLVGLLMQAQREHEATVNEDFAAVSPINTLKSIMEEGRGARSVAELSLLILRCATAVVNRGLLLAVEHGQALGMGQFGLQVPLGRANQRIKGIRIPLGEPSVIADAVSERRTFRGTIPPGKWNEYLLEQIGGDKPEESAIVPMLVNGDARLLFYGDNLPERIALGNLEILELLMLYAGIEMEKVLLESAVGE